jgi:hypothetical protein
LGRRPPTVGATTPPSSGSPRLVPVAPLTTIHEAFAPGELDEPVWGIVARTQIGGRPLGPNEPPGSRRGAAGELSSGGGERPGRPAVDARGTVARGNGTDAIALARGAVANPRRVASAS